MDLKANIEQLNEVINTHEANLLVLRDELKKAKKKRAAFLRFGGEG